MARLVDTDGAGALATDEDLARFLTRIDMDHITDRRAPDA
jgi:hypothetical protein